MKIGPEKARKADMGGESNGGRGAKGTNKGCPMSVCGRLNIFSLACRGGHYTRTVAGAVQDVAKQNEGSVCIYIRGLGRYRVGWPGLAG